MNPIRNNYVEENYPQPPSITPNKTNTPVVDIKPVDLTTSKLSSNTINKEPSTDWGKDYIRSFKENTSRVQLAGATLGGCACLPLSIIICIGSAVDNDSDTDADEGFDTGTRCGCCLGATCCCLPGMVAALPMAAVETSYRMVVHGKGKPVPVPVDPKSKKEKGQSICGECSDIYEDAVNGNNRDFFSWSQLTLDICKE